MLGNLVGLKSGIKGVGLFVVAPGNTGEGVGADKGMAAGDGVAVGNTSVDPTGGWLVGLAAYMSNVGEAVAPPFFPVSDIKTAFPASSSSIMITVAIMTTTIKASTKNMVQRQSSFHWRIQFSPLTRLSANAVVSRVVNSVIVGFPVVWSVLPVIVITVRGTKDDSSTASRLMFSPWSL